jgi:hypothetical protein
MSISAEIKGQELQSKWSVPTQIDRQIENAALNLQKSTSVVSPLAAMRLKWSGT